MLRPVRSPEPGEFRLGLRDGRAGLAPVVRCFSASFAASFGRLHRRRSQLDGLGLRQGRYCGTRALPRDCEKCASEAGVLQPPGFGQRRLGLRRGRRPRARALRRHRRDGIISRRALQLPRFSEPGPGLLERSEVLAEALRLHREDLPATRVGGVQLPGPREHGLRFRDRRPRVPGIVRCHRRGGAALDRELHGAGPGQHLVGLLRLRCRCSCLLHGGGRGPACSY
mmetsp:Transcript_17519/g.50028  ORF Transcript_17519/g.50028 Transcript_17519/m.50028 type:complete len:226 (-) Transcript_17519:447-1124(-)